MRTVKATTRRGDTIIEVMFAITIFSLVAMIVMNLMNSGIARAQVALETTMARNEIDAQAEAMRFIHNSLLAEREYASDKQEYIDLWKAIVEKPATDAPALNYAKCADAYNEKSNYFIINTRKLWENPASDKPAKIESKGKVIYGDSLKPATLYPRVIYSAGTGEDSTGRITESEDKVDAKSYDQVKAAEGIWMLAVSEQRPDPAGGTTTEYLPPEFYDIHIRTCWYGPGESTPRTIGTVLRLYNPDLVEKKDN